LKLLSFTFSKYIKADVRGQQAQGLFICMIASQPLQCFLYFPLRAKLWSIANNFFVLNKIEIERKNI